MASPFQNFYKSKPKQLEKQVTCHQSLTSRKRIKNIDKERPDVGSKHFDTQIIRHTVDIFSIFQEGLEVENILQPSTPSVLILTKDMNYFTILPQRHILRFRNSRSKPDGYCYISVKSMQIEEKKGLFGFRSPRFRLRNDDDGNSLDFKCYSNQRRGLSYALHRIMETKPKDIPRVRRMSQHDGMNYWLFVQVSSSWYSMSSWPFVQCTSSWNSPERGIGIIGMQSVWEKLGGDCNIFVLFIQKTCDCCWV